MARGLSAADIDQIAEHAAAGLGPGRTAELLGITRNVVAGVIFRLRKAGDPRVPAAGEGPIVTKVAQREALADAFADGAATLQEAAQTARLPLPIALMRWEEICRSLGRQAR